MSWWIGIPSYHRSETVGAKTLRVLAEGGVPRERVFLAIANDELGDYKTNVDPGLYGAFIQNVTPGSVADAHNAIVDVLGPGQVIHMDDDVRAVEQAVDGKLVPVGDLCELFDLGFDLCRSYHSTLWGVYPVHNAFYMERRVYTKLSLIIGQLCGQICTGAEHERTTLDVKNDYERSLQHFMRDGALCRLDWVCCDSPVYVGAGGLQDVRTPEVAWGAIHELQRRFPGLVKPRVRMSDEEWPEIDLLMPKAAKVPRPAAAPAPELPATPFPPPRGNRAKRRGRGRYPRGVLQRPRGF